MQYLGLIFLAIVVISIVAFMRNRSAYYSKIFSNEHYTEIGNWLCACLKLGPVSKTNFEDGSAFTSSAGCAFTFTRRIEDVDAIHIAVSQIGNHTTHAACSFIAFFILQILKQNKAQASFFYTESSVHHMVFQKDLDGDWITNDIDTAIEDMKLYERIHFEFEEMGVK